MQTSSKKLNTFNHAHTQFYQSGRFNYVTDQQQHKQPEHWQSLITEFKNGDVMNGDCEDAALTVIDLCLMHRIPAKNLAIARVATENSKLDYNHAVAVLLNDEQQIVAVSDNRYPNATHKTWHVHYRWYDLITVNALANNKPAQRLTHV